MFVNSTTGNRSHQILTPSTYTHYFHSLVQLTFYTHLFHSLVPLTFSTHMLHSLKNNEYLKLTGHQETKFNSKLYLLALT